MSRTSVLERGVTARAVAFALLLLLVTPLLLLASSESAQALTLCQAKLGESACISSILGGRDSPISGVEVTLTKPDGTTDQQTTGADGQFLFTVDKPGEYLVGINPDTVPKGLEILPRDKSAQGPNGTAKVEVDLKKANTFGVNFQIREHGFSRHTSKAGQIVNAAVSGVLLGLLLALASVGLSLIYGTTGLSNFAHAEQVTLGGMVGYGLINVWGLNLWLGGVLVMLICGFSGWLQDRVIWQPLRRRGLGLTQLMIVTIGLSLAMQYCFQFFVGADTKKIVITSTTARTWGPVTVTDRAILAMVISAVVLAVVGVALLRTRIGRATRAVSDNPALAQASGIDTDKVIRLVWTLSMALAGLSGLLYALVIQNGIKWDTGLQILLLLFASVTLGGLGTAFGALVGSLVIGLVVQVSPQFIPGDFKYAAALLILILLLLVRPQGLLGRAQRVG
jgi:branched-chain amino acid transport system permease protein